MRLTQWSRRLLQMARTKKILRWNRIPVVIVVRDRLEPLQELIAWLELEGMRRIVLVDNDSTYPPLLEYLEATEHEVVRLGGNVGPYSPWGDVVWPMIEGAPFIVTDSDVVPDPESHGAVRRFAHLLNRYPDFIKVGFGLHIDDIPDHYVAKDLVISHESQFYRNEIRPGVFRATIDTTFALYRAGQRHAFGPALRTGAPYLARHEPWYQDSANITADFRYYRSRAESNFATWGVSAVDSSDAYRE